MPQGGSLVSNSLARLPTATLFGMLKLRTDLGTFSLDFTTGMTTEQMVASLCNTNSFEIRGTWQVQETKTGRVLATTEEVTDNRFYYLTTTWLKLRQMKLHRTFAPG